MFHIMVVTLQFLSLVTFNTYVLGLKWSKKHLCILLTVALFPTILLYLYIGPLATLYFTITLSAFVYRNTGNRMTIIHVVMSLILLVISDNISGLILMRFFNQEMNTTIASAIYPLLFLFFSAIFAVIYKRIVLKLLKRWIRSKGSTYLLISLCMGTAIFIYMNIIKIDRSNFYENVKSNIILFLVFLLLLVVSFFIILSISFQRYKLNRRKEELESFETYVASIEEINRDMRKFKHDYVNMLTSLKIFIDDRNYEGLHTYYYNHILKMDAQERLNEQALMMLKNLKVDTLKGLFTTKILQAEARQVAFRAEVVDEITDIPVDPIILNRIVGILLDNAIEAACEAKNKKVQVALIRMDASVLLVLHNTYDIAKDLKVHELFQEGFSTKGKNRGLGLSTLREIKEQLPNINMRTKIHPPYFTQELEFGQEERK